MPRKAPRRRNLTGKIRPPADDGVALVKRITGGTGRAVYGQSAVDGVVNLSS